MKKFITTVRRLFTRKPVTAETPDCDIPPHVLAEYCCIQSNIFECSTYEQVAACRRWADQMHEKYPRYGVLRSKLYHQAGVQQRLITATSGLLSTIPGIVHANSKIS